MKIVKIPRKSFFKKAYKIFRDKLLEKNPDFNRIRRLCFNSEDLQGLMKSIGINEYYEISSGTSDRIAFKPYLKQIIDDIKNSRYYREYTTAKGNNSARKALAIFESLKLAKNDNYSAENICLTEGATEAITMFFEYFKDNYKNQEIIITAPNYYIYKFSAKYFCLKFKEILTLNKKNSFVSVDEIISGISNKTKLIVITNPSNPSGEVYAKRDLERLFNMAKEKNIFILVDELFSELVFDSKEYTYSDIIASKLNALNNIIIVKGYSKTKNLAAFRIGYLLSKNEKIINAVARIAEQRRCFPSASNYAGLICLDSFIQSLNWLTKIYDYPVTKAIKYLKNEFNAIEIIREMKTYYLNNIYILYQKYLKETLDFYSEMYDKMLEILKKEIEVNIQKKSAFNTFIKIKDIDNINFFDFTLNLFLTTGVKIEIGPGFGLSQKQWETDKRLGFWLRITFARNKRMFIKGLKKFVAFKKLYLKNKDKFLKTNLYF